MVISEEDWCDCCILYLFISTTIYKGTDIHILLFCNMYYEFQCCDKRIVEKYGTLDLSKTEFYHPVKITADEVTLKVTPPGGYMVQVRDMGHVIPFTTSDSFVRF